MYLPQKKKVNYVSDKNHKKTTIRSQSSKSKLTILNSLKVSEKGQPLSPIINKPVKARKVEEKHYNALNKGIK